MKKYIERIRFLESLDKDKTNGAVQRSIAQTKREYRKMLATDQVEKSVSATEQEATGESGKEE